MNGGRVLLKVNWKCSENFLNSSAGERCKYVDCRPQKRKKYFETKNKLKIKLDRKPKRKLKLN